MSYKVWSYGEKVASADLNGYIVNQTIPRFATTGARDAAITSPSEGQFAYVTSVGLTYRNASAWVVVLANTQKRMHAGATTATSDTGGNITITHAAGFTPTGVVATGYYNGGGPGGILGIDSITATTFRVRHLGISVATSLTTMWIAFE